MARHASNVTRKRRTLGPRDLLRATVFVVALAVGIATAWAIGPHQDYLTTDLTLGYGLVLGLVLAFALASQVRVTDDPPRTPDTTLDEDRHTRLRRELLGDDAVEVEYDADR